MLFHSSFCLENAFCLKFNIIEPKKFDSLLKLPDFVKIVYCLQIMYYRGVCVKIVYKIEIIVFLSVVCKGVMCSFKPLLKIKIVKCFFIAINRLILFEF